MTSPTRWTVPEIGTKRLVGGVAVLAMLLRFPGMLWPIRPDEAGFTLVARAWHPQPDSLYGTYWVDRPPPLIALIKLSDWIGGPLFIRVIAALGCALLVVAAARTAYLVSGERAARWTAVATAAVTTNTMIDSVAAKGEILGIPIVVTSFWLALEALRVLDASPRKGMLLAGGAGLLGMLAIGLKQNMATGLAFGGVVLLTSAVRKEISWPAFGRLAGAALLGAAIPLGLTIGWCLATGVHLETLWYAVYGFRSHALDVISNEEAGAPLGRARQLAIIFVATGMAFVVAWFLINIKHAWRTHPAVTLAAVAVLVVDGTGVILGGSYWRPYLLGIVPTVVLCAALVVGAPGLRGRITRLLVALTAVSCLVSTVGWVAKSTSGAEPPTEIYTGQAIKRVSEPGDTIVVYGGRADIVFASGLSSPYEHLWSLPMRGNDPKLEELIGLLDSDKAPTWFVGWVDFDSWNGVGQPALEAMLAQHYERHGEACGDHPIWLHKGVDRDLPVPDCERPWRW
ncbi:hypothetical protein [Nocardioides jensenii]|uniref:hypothetical protein n=1 Tax=Nocardioides jensenii TaxID=1843 RepID=UPI00082CC695|nr:hypothetical protein [Nocardioides jensenii]